MGGGGRTVVVMIVWCKIEKNNRIGEFLRRNNEVRMYTVRSRVLPLPFLTVLELTTVVIVIVGCHCCSAAIHTAATAASSQAGVVVVVVSVVGVLSRLSLFVLEQ